MNTSFNNHTSYENREIIKAMFEGKKVEYWSNLYSKWSDYNAAEENYHFGPWNCRDEYTWRIKPEAVTKTVTITKPVVVTNRIKHDIPVQLENLKTDFYKAGERIWYVYVTSSNEVTKNEMLVNHNQDKEYKNHFIFTSKEAMEKGYEVIQKLIKKETNE